MLPLIIVSTIFCIGGLVIIQWLHAQYHLDIVVMPEPPPPKGPLITVCVPARNEERNIQPCVEAVLQQDYPNFEVIILDDRSTDSTPKILRQLTEQRDKLQIITGSDLPAGWAGKPHALHQAATAARGEWLCFVDADTFLKPNALSACYASAVKTNADMFTMMTFQILGTFWEKAIMPLVMTALSVGFSPRKVNNPRRREAIANGQFILIKRSIYDAIGGHESVKDKIVEDKAIAEQVKWNGHRLILADGKHAAQTRMYTSLPEMWEGWTKNIYLGLREQTSLLWLGVFGAFLAVMAAIILPMWPLLGLFGLSTSGDLRYGIVVIESLLVWGFLIHKRVMVAREMQISRWHTLTTPLGAAVFGSMMFVSAWKVLTRKGVTWKGRTYHQ